MLYHFINKIGSLSARDFVKENVVVTAGGRYKGFVLFGFESENKYIFQRYFFKKLGSSTDST